MAFDVLIRALFSDSGVSAGLARMNAGLKELGSSGPAARTGIRVLEGGLRSLAFEAVGVQGPVGKVAQGLLQFGGGSALILGAAAGIGVIALAYRAATQEARELAAANERLNKTWASAAAQGKPVVGAMNEFIEATKEATDAQEKLDQLTSKRTIVGGRGHVTTETVGTAAEIAAAQANVAAAARNVQLFRQRLELEEAQLVADAQQKGKKFATAFFEGIANLDPSTQVHTTLVAKPQFDRLGGEAGRMWAKGLLQEITLLDADAQIRTLLMTRPNFTGLGKQAGEEWARAYLRAIEQAGGFRPTQMVPTVPGVLRPPIFLQRFDLRPFESPDIRRRPRPTEFEPFGGTLGPPQTPLTFANIRANQPRFVTPELPRLTWENGGRILAQSFVTAIGQIASGQPGGIFGGLGSIAAGAAEVPRFAQAAPFLGPLGFGLATFGTLLTLFGSGEKERHRDAERQIDELKAIRANTERRGRPERESFTLVVNGREIVGAIIDDVIYAIRRQERRDAVQRLPSR